MVLVERNCDYCKRKYKADSRNLKRGWDLCCNKKCAAKKREQLKRGIKTETTRTTRVVVPTTLEEERNQRRKKYRNVIPPSIALSSGEVEGFTPEGYRVMDGVVYNEFDEPVYTVDFI